jgi:hypothetical protein
VGNLRKNLAPQQADRIVFILLQRPSYGLKKILHGTGFRQSCVVVTALESGQILFELPRDDDDPHARRRMNLAHAPQDLRPVHPRHVQVEEEEVRHQRQCRGQSRLSVTRLVDRDPVVHQKLDEGRAEIGIVIGDQDSLHAPTYMIERELD